MSIKKIIVLVILLAAGFCAWKIFGPSVNAPDSKYFYIKTGSSYADVRSGLVEQNIIGGTFFFDKLSGLMKYNEVKPGRYEITKGMSLFNLVRLLKAGNQSPVKLVITKLRTTQNLASLIAKNFECDSASVMNYLNNSDSLAMLGVDTNTVMTLVIPNTYSINWNIPFARIMKRLSGEADKFWTKERKDKAGALNLSPKQAYTLASIVESETNLDEDKGKVASVYLNRIETGMTLDADPTLIFALKDFTIKRVLDKHKQIESPFNTYRFKGLPPGPICTPSINTIDAVLNAPSTNYLFFAAEPHNTGR